MDAAIKEILVKSKGVEVTEDERDRMVEEAVEYFAENPTEYLWWARTGNMMFIALREYTDDETPTNRIEIFDCNVIRQGEVYV
jgi:hypothetical protein